jgi:hypothetical protein
MHRVDRRARTSVAVATRLCELQRELARILGLYPDLAVEGDLCRLPTDGGQLTALRRGRPGAVSRSVMMSGSVSVSRRGTRYARRSAS